MRKRSQQKLPRLLALDGTWLIHRAFHVRPSAVPFMVFGWVCKAVVEHKCSHAMVAFDSGRSFRHDYTVDYKGTRPPKQVGVLAPSDMLIPTSKYIQDFGIHCQLGGIHEADDVLATVGDVGPTYFKEVLLGTPDKDNLQCITEACKILKIGVSGNPDKIIGLDELHAEHGLTPAQFLDYQTLIGDKTDNIPAIITPAKAKKMILEYGSLKAWLLENPEFVGEHAGALMKNRKLVKLVKDCFELDPDRYAVSLMDKSRNDCRSLFYHTLRQQLSAPKRLF